MLSLMDQNSQPKSLDSILENFDLSLSEDGSCPDDEPVTFWIPAEYKAKFDQLQRRSKRKFGKLVKEILKYSIDKKIENEAN